MHIWFGEAQFNEGTLTIPFKDESRSSSLRFSLPQDWELDRDLVALALTTLLGTKYSTVELSDEISGETRRIGEQLTHANWIAPESPASFAHVNEGRRGLALNFSGGFDSLAALALLPRDTNLISLDFGGPFSREREFFQDFPTYSISTNFRDLGFALNTWAFMGIGSILLRDYLNLANYSFGAILEASAWHFNPATTSGRLKQPWYNSAHLEVFNPVIGMTEVGTAMIIVRHRPELALRSLASVASAGSLKHTRKLLLLHAARTLFPTPITLDDIDTERSPLGKFGDNFANDFLSFYLHRKLGEKYSRLLVGEIPTEILGKISRLSLRFYERINTNFYSGMPSELTARALAEAALAGCTPYTYTDWQEFMTVKDILAKYHQFPV